jgi:F-type H+-transporting ATPase subunit delta
MLSSKASRRYASALLKLAVENKTVDTVIADIGVMKSTFDGSKELILVLANPIVRKDKKLAILADLFKSRVGKTTWRLIELMAEKDRLALLPGMAHDYIRQHNLFAGILEVQITSAFDLDETQKKNLLESLESKTGKKIQATFHTNPELRGGVVVRIEDTVIDGSVKHKLEQLKQTLYRTAV